jgi:peptidoglycan/xylan/chitin deacetylase (PgdA/CDA1 family)
VSQGGIPYLMYHEIEVPGRRVIQDTPGYLRYVVKEKDFSDQLGALADSSFTGVNVTTALSATKTSQKVVAITFDDGCETDLLVAAPLLKERSFNATFYLVAGFLDRPGYLSTTQARALKDFDFEIGSHSMTHSYLRRLDNTQLRAEIFDSKDRLEQLIGSKVDHFSCPGGRWDSRVSELAQLAGYLSVATSDTGTNSDRSDPYHLLRLAVFRDTSHDSFSSMCRGEGLALRRLKNTILDGAKDFLGDSTYDRLRARMLGRDQNRKINASRN